MADPVSIAINVALVAANMALTASQQFEGPRLDDLSVTTADYGAVVNYVYGVRRLDGVSCIWAEPLTEVKRRRKTKGGKFNDYTYFGTWAVAVCDHEIDKVLRIWFDRNLVYDATGAGPISPFSFGESGDGPVGEAVAQLGLGNIVDYIRIYYGTDDQEPDPRMAATVDAEFGEGSTPAYRGVAYIVFQDLPLEKLGNRLPQVSVEVTTLGEVTFPSSEEAPVNETDSRIWLSEDGSRAYWTSVDPVDSDITHLEGWDLRALAPMVHVTHDNLDTFTELGVDDFGRIYSAHEANDRLVVMSPEGVQIKTVGPPDITWGANYADFPLIAGVTVLDNIAYCRALSPDNGAWRYLYPDNEAELIAGPSGGEYRCSFFFKDAYGGHWMLGGGGDLADDILVVRQLVAGVDAPSTVGLKLVTMPVSNAPSSVAAHGYHCQDGSDDYIIVRFGTGSGCVVRLDWETLTISNSIVGNAALGAWSRQQAAALRPGSRYAWVGEDEWDLVDMTVVRSVDYEDWAVEYATGFTIYDRIDHSLLWVGAANDTLAKLYLDRATGEGVTLRSIVEDVSERCGLIVANDIDATDLTQTVRGYSWTQGQGKAILEPLLEAFDCEARPHDFEIEFLRRGDAVLDAIPVAQMGAGGSVRYEVATTLDSDLPLKANMTYADLDSDQQPNTAIAQRAGAATDSRRELSLSVTTLATDPDEARPMVDGYLRREWMKAQTITLSLTRAYTKLEPGDAYTLHLDDVERTAKLKRLEFGANGVLTTEWERYAPAVHVASALLGAPADGLEPSVIPVFGYTKGLFLDIPLVQDGDDDLIAYLAAAPYSSDTAWPGADFQRSDDEGETYDETLGSVASTQAATIGYALSALPDALATVWDNASTVSVKLYGGEITSSTKALVGNGANRVLLGDEIIGFTTATLIAENTYQLSGLHRGRRGTEWATGTHASGERFVLLDSLPQAEMAAADVGDSFYVRPVTNGGPNGFPEDIDPYTGASLKPYAPAHLAVAESSGDLVVTWTRRTRIGGTWHDYQDVPLGEGSEAYLGRIVDAGGNIIRSFTGLTSPTFTYTSAQQATDGSPAGVEVHVCQISATVGNGFFAEAAL